MGTGKTLTPAGTVLDGNGGANYAITFVNDTTGVITGRAVTVTADSGQAKIYGTPDPTFTYTITPAHCSRVTASPVRWPASRVRTSASRHHPGHPDRGSELHASPSCSADFTIVARAITVTATSDTKVYDSTTASAAVPTVTPVASPAPTPGRSPRPSTPSTSASPRP